MSKTYDSELYSLLCDIWGYSETAFEEKKSCARMVEFLREQGLSLIHI